MRIRPMAMGMFVVPLDILSMLPEIDGNKYPEATPMAMAKNIQRVKYLSKNLRRFFIFQY